MLNQQHSKGSFQGNRTLALAGVILLLMLAWKVVSLLYAEVLTVIIDANLSTDPSTSLALDKATLHDLQKNIDTTISISPGNPEYRSKNILLHRATSAPSSADTLDPDPYDLQSLQTYRQLIALRPTWAPYWAELVQTKRRLWQYDQEMQDAIQNAANYGPWFPATQRIILISGFDGWPFISKASREAVNSTLLRALQQRPQETIRLAMDRGFLPQALPVIQSDAGLEAIYQKELQRRKHLLTTQQPGRQNG